MISTAKLKHILSDFLYFIDTYIISYCRYSSYFTSPVNRQRDPHLPSKSMGRSIGEWEGFKATDEPNRDSS